MRRAFFLVLAVLLGSLGCLKGQAPQRGSWVALSPALTEILFEVGAGRELAGVCAPVSYPKEALELPVLAGWNRVDTERVLASGAKACFTNTGVHSPEALAAIERNGIPVHVYSLNTVASVADCLEEVGKATGHAAQGERAADEFRRRLQKVALALPPAGRRKAVVIVGLDPLVLAGRASFPSDVISSAGFQNALPGFSELYPAVSLESLAVGKPRVVVWPEEMMAAEGRTALVTRLNELLDQPVAEVEINGDLLVRPAPRVIEGVEKLAALRERIR